MSLENKSTEPKLSHKVLAESLYINLINACVKPAPPNESFVVSQGENPKEKAYEGGFIISREAVLMAESLGLSNDKLGSLLIWRLKSEGIKGAFGKEPWVSVTRDSDGIDFVDFRVDMNSLNQAVEKHTKEQANRRKK